MIPSIMCYVSPSVQLLGPTSPPPLSNPDPWPPDFKPDWRHWFYSALSTWPSSLYASYCLQKRYFLPIWSILIPDVCGPLVIADWWRTSRCTENCPKWHQRRWKSSRRILRGSGRKLKRFVMLEFHLNYDNDSNNYNFYSTVLRPERYRHAAQTITEPNNP